MGSPPQPRVGRPPGYRHVLRVALPLNAGAGRGLAPIGEGPIPQPLQPLLETAPDFGGAFSLPLPPGISATGPSLNDEVVPYTLHTSTDPLPLGSVSDVSPIVPSNSPTLSRGVVLHCYLFIVPRLRAVNNSLNKI